MASNKKINNNPRVSVSHALTIFTIAATFSSLFTPAYLNGATEGEKKEYSKLMQKRELLVERRNKELSLINSLKTPESVYQMALSKDLDLQLANDK